MVELSGLLRAAPSVIERIVVDAEGMILRIDLLPPFAYLHDLSCRIQMMAENEAKKKKPVLRPVLVRHLPL